jgi:hypothetical protein
MVGDGPWKQHSQHTNNYNEREKNIISRNIERELKTKAYIYNIDNITTDKQKKNLDRKN